MVNSFIFFSSVLVTEFLSLMKQLLHEKFLRTASADRLSCNRLEALQCQEKEGYIED